MKKSSIFNWLSITAVIIAILAFGIAIGHWISDAVSKTAEVTTVSTESFIGVLVSLLAICVTFAIGYQIVNTLDIKESVKEMNVLKQEFESTKKELINVESRIEANRCNYQAITAGDEDNYPLALCFYAKALKYALKCNNNNMISTILNNINVELESWNISSENYDPSKFRHTIDEKEPIEKMIDYFIAIVEECSECVLYSSYIPMINNLKEKCELKIEEHEAYMKATEEKNR